MFEGLWKGNGGMVKLVGMGLAEFAHDGGFHGFSHEGLLEMTFGKGGEGARRSPARQVSLTAPRHAIGELFSSHG